MAACVFPQIRVRQIITERTNMDYRKCRSELDARRKIVVEEEASHFKASTE